MAALKNLLTDLGSLKNPAKASVLERFFKTGKGEYGEGDIFWGIVVPDIRSVARKYFSEISFSDLKYLLSQPTHELRFSAIAILVLKYQKAKTEPDKEVIAKFYLKNLKGINNWDLVDLSAPQILGDYFFDKNKEVLYELAYSKNLWKKRIAILSTFGFIRKNEFVDTLKIAEILLFDRHDLIHKAVGWMLREIGKRDKEKEIVFLKKYSKQMPRTTLRYAIEKFEERERKSWLG
ncbi:MAG: DNA alkylation repair protein [Candidatus Moraniibacteriota bacterium]